MKCLKGVRCLIVEHNAELRKVLVNYIDRLGVEVISASNGRKGYNSLLKQPVDFVVADIGMPKGEGLDLVARIQSSPLRSIKIILTADFIDLNHGFLTPMLKKDVEAIFPKPFDIAMLRQVIEIALYGDSELWRRAAKRMEMIHRVVLAPPNGVPKFSCPVTNISRGGMFLESSVLRAKPNDVLGFKILFGDIHCPPIEGNAIVRWLLAPKGIGVAFTDFVNGSGDRLLMLLNSLKTGSMSSGSDQDEAGIQENLQFS